MTGHPLWRASAVGVYRLWRDLGYAIGALLAGVTADMFGLGAALWVVATLTLLSGVVSAARMTETLPAPVATHRSDGAEPRAPISGSARPLSMETRKPEQPSGERCLS